MPTVFNSNLFCDFCSKKKTLEHDCRRTLARARSLTNSTAVISKLIAHINIINPESNNNNNEQQQKNNDHTKQKLDSGFTVFD